MDGSWLNSDSRLSIKFGMRSKFLFIVLVATSLISAACAGQSDAVAEPIRGFDGQVVDSESVLEDSAVSAAETVSPDTTTTPSTTPAIESDPSEADLAPPDSLPLVDTDPLCTDIDTVIDALLVGDEAVLAAMEGSDPLVGRHLPTDLQGPDGSALPLVAGPEFLVLWDRLDAFTTETCGLPFLATFMGTSAACLDDFADIGFDAGQCIDPRVSPESVLSGSEVLELLQTLGAAVR